MNTTESLSGDFQVSLLRPLVEAALSQARAALPAEVGLVGLISDIPIQVHCNAVQLEEVIVGLCITSWLALGSKGGRVAVALDDITLNEVVLDDQASSLLGGLPPRRHARLCVSNGSLEFEGAVPVADTPPLAQDVAQVGRSRLRMNAISKIIKAHKGTLNFYDLQDEGLNYEIYLPAVLDDALRSTHAGPVASSGPARRHRVLYADDYESMRALLTGVLEDSGCDVTPCARAADVVAALSAAPHDFDLVVTDQSMPGLSGIELTHAVRAIRADMPVAILSGNMDDHLRSLAAAADVNLLLSKSDDIESLCGELMNLIRFP
jgi:two-component system cell cycle sensor histidine kinase/response regulator CckA